MADPGPGRLLTFVRELKRRHVVRVGVVYAVIGFSVLQVATNFFPALLLPAWTVTLVAVLIVLGFPIALVLAWAFEITPEGVKRDEAPPAASVPAPPMPKAARRALPSSSTNISMSVPPSPPTPAGPLLPSTVTLPEKVPATPTRWVSSCTASFNRPSA